MSEEFESLSTALKAATPPAYIDAQTEALEFGLRTFDRAKAAELAAHARHSHSLKGMVQSFNESIGWRPAALICVVFSAAIYGFSMINFGEGEDEGTDQPLEEVIAYDEPNGTPDGHAAADLGEEGDAKASQAASVQPPEQITRATSVPPTPYIVTQPATIVEAPEPNVPPPFDLARLVNGVDYNYPTPKPPQKITAITSVKPSPWNPDALLVVIGLRLPENRSEVTQMSLTLAWDDNKVTKFMPRASTSDQHMRHRLSLDGTLTNVYEVEINSSLKPEDRIGTLRLSWSMADDPREHLHSMPITLTSRPNADHDFAAALTGYGLILQNENATGPWGIPEALSLAETALGQTQSASRARAIATMRAPVPKKQQP